MSFSNCQIKPMSSICHNYNFPLMQCLSPFTKISDRLCINIEVISQIPKDQITQYLNKGKLTLHDYIKNSNKIYTTFTFEFYYLKTQPSIHLSPLDCIAFLAAQLLKTSPPTEHIQDAISINFLTILTIQKHMKTPFRIPNYTMKVLAHRAYVDKHHY